MVYLVHGTHQTKERGDIMIDTDKLRGVIASQKTSQRQVARELGISEKTFYCKMKKGVFDSDEIEQMISILNIGNPLEIFFTSFGAQHAPNKDDNNKGA